MSRLTSTEHLMKVRDALDSCVSDGACPTYEEHVLLQNLDTVIDRRTDEESPGTVTTSFEVPIPWADDSPSFRNEP